MGKIFFCEDTHGASYESHPKRIKDDLDEEESLFSKRLDVCAVGFGAIYSAELGCMILPPPSDFIHCGTQIDFNESMYSIDEMFGEPFKQIDFEKVDNLYTEKFLIDRISNELKGKKCPAGRSEKQHLNILNLNKKKRF